MSHMEQDNTIPSQLGPASTIPVPLISSSQAPHQDVEVTGAGPLIFKLVLLAVTVGLALYFAR